MATEAITPNVGAGAPPAAEVSSPAPETTAAPETSSAKLDYSTFDSPEAYIDAALKQTPKAEEEQPEEVPTAPETEVAAPEVAEPEVEAKTEETKAAEEPQVELEDDVILSPQALAKEIGKDPQVKAFFDANPELKSRMFAAVRRDSENRAIREVFPDVDTAKEAATHAATWQSFDDAFLSGDPKALMNRMVEEAIVRDEQGRPVMENGQPKLHDSLIKFTEFVRQNELDYLRKTAEKNGNDRLLVALDVIREELSPNSPALDDMPEHVKAAAAHVKAQQDALDRQRAEQQQSQNRASLEKVGEVVSDKTNSLLKPLFEKAALSKFAQEAAQERIEKAVIEKMKSHPLYQSVRSRILQKPPSEEREKQLVAHDMRYIHQFIGPVATQIIREAADPAIRAQAAKQDKVAAQVAASKTEPKGSSVSGAPQSAADPKAIKAQIVEEYRAKNNGEDPSIEYVLAEAMKRDPRTARRA